MHLDLDRDAPTDDDLAALILGPSGALRAPALRRGATLIIGFEPEMYAKVIGER